VCVCVCVCVQALSATIHTCASLRLCVCVWGGGGGLTVSLGPPGSRHPISMTFLQAAAVRVHVGHVRYKGVRDVWEGTEGTALLMHIHHNYGRTEVVCNARQNRTWDLLQSMRKEQERGSRGGLREDQ
jgi:hypothetical protein